MWDLRQDKNKPSPNLALARSCIWSKQRKEARTRASLPGRVRSWPGQGLSQRGCSTGSRQCPLQWQPHGGLEPHSTPTTHAPMQAWLEFPLCCSSPLLVSILATSSHTEMFTEVVQVISRLGNQLPLLLVAIKPRRFWELCHKLIFLLQDTIFSAWFAEHKGFQEHKHFTIVERTINTSQVPTYHVQAMGQLLQVKLQDLKDLNLRETNISSSVCYSCHHKVLGTGGLKPQKNFSPF